MAGKGNALGGGRYPSVGNVLSGSGASISIVWIGIVGPVGGNANEGGGNPYKLPKEYHREEGSEKQRRDVVNTDGPRGVEGGWNSDSVRINCPHTGDGVTVGGFKTNI